jgi:uncharacterized DUF497 family protein
MDERDPLFGCTGFEWDEHNSIRNWEAHRVSGKECEELFFHSPLVVEDDPRHSIREARYYALGQTAAGRMLFIAFTISEDLIRVISARDMSRREREVYRSL